MRSLGADEAEEGSCPLPNDDRDGDSSPPEAMVPNQKQAEFLENVSSDPRPHESNQAHHIHSYGTLNTFGMAANVNTGPVYGTVIMNSSDDDIAKLRDQLKISPKADHRYYPEGDEKASRRSHCTAGTRIRIRGDVSHWATNSSPDSEKVYWLSGQAGAGKSTIAHTICHEFESVVSNENGRALLGASFFCSRQFPETRSARAVFRTLAYQLSLKSEAFRAALIECGRFETIDHSPKAQLEALLVEPWAKSGPRRSLENEVCYIISIEALDELDGEGGSELLATLFDTVNQHALLGLKFFVTSRSDPALVERIEAFHKKQVCRLEEVPIQESSADIKLYLEENLGQSATIGQIEQLVSDADGLFIYAATVVEYLKGREVEEQRALLIQLLSLSRAAGYGVTAKLDDLYFQILEASLVDPRDYNNANLFQNCLSILHTFLSTIERTSPSVCIGLLDPGGSALTLNTGLAAGVIRRLHAVLHTQDGQVMWFHKSFPDFVFDEQRSRKFYCNQELHHRRLVDGCFGVMNRQLRFNIADIPSSHRLDRDDPTLFHRINANISAVLRHACANWSGHLIRAPRDLANDLLVILHDLLQLRILFWMEVMNLLGKRGACEGMLRDVLKWVGKPKGPERLAIELTDAAAFAMYFSSSGAALSTPHLYISSLATFQRNSALLERWREHFIGIPGFIHARGTTGDTALSSFIIGGKVNAVAVSADGTSITVGSSDDLIHVWELFRGEEAKAFKGHRSVVRSVAYSPNGTHFVSGSNDNSVRLWDLSSGEEVKVFKGHTDWVNSVAYSPSGAHVISGSDDKSIRVWDLLNGVEVKVLKGHTSWVCSVAYSPNGTHVVSGSGDKSIRVWDLSGREAVKVLEGHSDYIRSVAYAPNGSHVVSGSDDTLVRVWDLSSGQVVKIFEGHSGCVTSVAYSPNGTYVVSGSGDKSIRVWDLSRGQVLKAFEGHSDWVRSVAWAPNGTHIVSGSEDKSVRVWDLSSGDGVKALEGGTSSMRSVASPTSGARGTSRFRGTLGHLWDSLGRQHAKEQKKAPEYHTGTVSSVAYSPTSNHVASGSINKSIRIWDLSKRQQVKVLEGHTDDVNSVAYSPDGTQLVSGSSDRSVRVWDVSTGQQVKVFRGHTSLVSSVAYSPTTNHVASGSKDKSIRIWDLSKRRQVKILQRHTEFVKSVAYSPDGKQLVSGSADGSVRVWDVSSGRQVKVFKGHTSTVTSVTYSPSGTTVVSGSADNSVRVWGLSGSEEVKVLVGHTDWVNSVNYSPGGTYMVSGSDDRSIRVWDLASGETVKVLEGHTNTVSSVTYSPSGTGVVSGSSDKSVRVWDVTDALPRYIRHKGQQEGYSGWLVSPSDPMTHLMFIPPTICMADSFLLLTFPLSLLPHVDFSRAQLGDRWIECFTPRSS